MPHKTILGKKKEGVNNSLKLHSRKKRMPSWNSNNQRLVLFADFMGFKNRVDTYTHPHLLQEMREFHKKFTNVLKPLKITGYLKEVQFSDSIIITVKGIDFKSFNLISKAAIGLMHNALKMGLPIKGVIAQGNFTFDENNELYIGKALVDAYLLEEDVKYYGIVVHNTAEKTVKKYTATDNLSNPYSNNKIYISKGKTCHYHLCWNMINETLSFEDITPKCKDWIETIAEGVSGEPRLYIDHTLEILDEDSKSFNKEENDDDALDKTK